ncbi:MAG: heme-copper oxidase subunit III [Deltaproteobacteria bacterium]|nr:heme-copper oxidase subunit III [Deltaproteobacteria bacterium]
MARGSTARQVVEPQAGGENREILSFAGGGPPSPPTVSDEPIVSNARLGLLMFLAAEAMFFAGLIGSFLVFRLSSAAWPPPFQPRLPVVVTGINTVILLLSGITMHLALRAVRRGNLSGLMRYLLTTAVLGALFLSIQGYEWVRLVQFGLMISSGIYGATFYTLIGCHGLHVLGAVVWLMVVWMLARSGRFTAQRHTGVELCAMYWTFVVAVWPVLYGLVYLY